MRRVYVSDLVHRVQMVRAVLEMDGISACVQNEHAATSLWDVVASWPEVWIYDDEDYESARQTVDEVVASFQSVTTDKGTTWRWWVMAALILGYNGVLVVLLEYEEEPPWLLRILLVLVPLLGLGAAALVAHWDRREPCRETDDE